MKTSIYNKFLSIYIKKAFKILFNNTILKSLMVVIKKDQIFIIHIEVKTSRTRLP